MPITIKLDPMTQCRANSARRLESHIVNFELLIAPKERVWNDKRMMAGLVKEAQGKLTASEFNAEADARGMTQDAFADLVLSKPDASTAWRARELQRQKYLLQIERASTIEELDAIENDAITNYGKV